MEPSTGEAASGTCTQGPGDRARNKDKKTNKLKELAMREESNDGLPEAVQRTQFQALDRVMAMASFDLDGVLRHANRNYLQLLGLSQDQALKVPVSAVFPRTDADGMAVFVLDHGRARLVPVVLGARNGTEAWVRSGLREGAQVIVYPPASVHDGAAVRVRRV